MVKNYSSHGKRRLLIALVIVAGASIGGYLLWHHNESSKTAPISAGTATKGEPAVSSKGSNGTSDQSSSVQPGDNKGSGGSTTATLLDPTGDFVSNHRPNLSGNPAPNTLTSVCTTTPGATCAITFTKDGVSKTLPSQTTDRGGSTFWNNWSLSDYGLTTGSWQIKATAVLNGQTKTMSDALVLEVTE